LSSYLVDTSVIIDVLRGVKGRGEALQQLVADGHLLACTAINVAEVFAGMRPKERAPTAALIDSFEHHDITRSVAEQAGLLRREWATRGRTLTLQDCLIASVALTHGLVLVTDNTKDFPMPELFRHSLDPGRS
jgi:predicted nucleic acid-binding protein